MLLFGFISCNMKENNAPIFIRKVYNDTFKINADFDTTKIDTLYYDVNDDGQSDLVAIYTHLEFLSETSFGFGSVRNDFFAYDSLFRFKSFLINDTISQSNFSNQHILPYQIFNYNPSGLTVSIDMSKVDTSTGIYYLAIMDDSFGNTNHNFTWLKFKLYQNITADSRAVIFLESGYNVTPLNTIKIGEY